MPENALLRGTVTTAHREIFRFYRGLSGARKPSTVERIASAPSPFAVEGLVADFEAFASGASQKARDRVREAARVRICQLRGLLPMVLASFVVSSYW